jgi:hypothetical protein
MYSGEYDVCDVILSVHPHRASWKICLATVGIEPATLEYTDIEGTIDSVPKYHQLEPTWPRSSVGRALD